MSDRERWEVAVREHRLALALVPALVVAGCVAAWCASGGARATLTGASAADPHRLLLAGLAFTVSLGATALGWRLAFSAVGASVGKLDACAWFASGSLVNTFCPARIGEGVRAALFAHHLPRREGRVLIAAGAVGASAASRALVQAILFGAAALVGIVPLWPVLGLAGVVAGGAAVAVVLGRRGGNGRAARLLETAGAAARSPRLAVGLVGSAALAAVARVGAAASVASAVGVANPLVAALLITAALDVALALPLTPGGIGITSGAVSLALALRGIDFSNAFAAGVVFHAVETAATLAFAGVAIPLAARPHLAARPALRVAAAAVLVALLAATATPSVFDLG